MQLKFYKYFIGAYGAVLLVSLALFYLLPKDDLLDLVFSTAGAGEEEMYYDAWWTGELEGQEGVYRYKQWHLDHEGDCLEIVSGSRGEVPIIIKRTAAGEGEVTAVEYRKEGFPFEEQLIPVQIDFTGNRLIIHDPGRYEFKIKAFMRDVALDQFKEKSESQLHVRIFHEFDYFQVFYLYIPAGVELAYDPGSIFLIMADE